MDSIQNISADIKILQQEINSYVEAEGYNEYNTLLKLSEQLDELINLWMKYYASQKLAETKGDRILILNDKVLVT